MLRNLSQYERDTLVRLAREGSGGDYDPIIMSKLFVMGLISVGNDRRVGLTASGEAFYAEILRHIEANEKQRDMECR